MRRLALPTDPLLGPCTLNVGLIQGGVAPNVIPDTRRRSCLFRTVRAGRTASRRRRELRARRASR